jgi:hypothetical protein
MKLDELQREAERLSPEDQRKLIGFLVAMDLRRDEGYMDELSRRLDAKEGSINLNDAERRLESDGI